MRITYRIALQSTSHFIPRQHSQICHLLGNSVCRETQSHLHGEKDLPFCSHVGVSAQVIPRGLASRSGLRVGDRILEVNSIDLRHATHQEAVNALLSNAQELTMVVRRDPPPPGMQVGSEQGGWGGITQGGFWVQFLTRLEV